MTKFRIKSRLSDGNPRQRRAAGTPVGSLLRNLAGDQPSEDSGISSGEDEGPPQNVAPAQIHAQPQGGTVAVRDSPHTPAARPAQTSQQLPASSMSAQRSFLSSFSSPTPARPQASRLGTQTARHGDGSLQAMLGRPQQQSLASPSAVGTLRRLCVQSVRRQGAILLVDCSGRAEHGDAQVQDQTMCTIVLKAQIAEGLELRSGIGLRVDAACEILEVAGCQVLMPLWVAVDPDEQPEPADVHD